MTTDVVRPTNIAADIGGWIGIVTVVGTFVLVIPTEGMSVVIGFFAAVVGAIFTGVGYQNLERTGEGRQMARTGLVLNSLMIAPIALSAVITLLVVMTAFVVGIITSIL